METLDKLSVERKYLPEQIFGTIQDFVSTPSGACTVLGVHPCWEAARHCNLRKHSHLPSTITLLPSQSASQKALVCSGLAISSPTPLLVPSALQAGLLQYSSAPALGDAGVY